MGPVEIALAAAVIGAALYAAIYARIAAREARAGRDHMLRTNRALNMIARLLLVRPPRRIVRPRPR